MAATSEENDFSVAKTLNNLEPSYSGIDKRIQWLKS